MPMRIQRCAGCGEPYEVPVGVKPARIVRCHKCPGQLDEKALAQQDADLADQRDDLLAHVRRCEGWAHIDDHIALQERVDAGRAEVNPDELPTAEDEEERVNPSRSILPALPPIEGLDNEEFQAEMHRFQREFSQQMVDADREQRRHRANDPNRCHCPHCYLIG